ncbi:MAG: PP2C family protein-serine/threonine phosphatase, partial [Bacteroidota bacterium]
IERGILAPEEARDHPNVHVIRRYLGSAQPPEVDFRLYLGEDEDDEKARLNQGAVLEPGDVILICTDGLTDLLWDDEILGTVQSRPNLREAAEALVELANRRGGHDNVTVVLIAVPRPQEETRRSRGFADWLRGIFGGQ